MAAKGITNYAYAGCGGKQSSPTPTGTPDTVKFNPGFYWAVQHGSGGDSTVNYILSWPTVKTEVNTYAALRGILMRVSWRDIETAKDVYNFAKIDKVVTELKALSNGPKRLCIILELKTNKRNPLPPAAQVPPDPICPDYAMTAEYEGGQLLWVSENSDNVTGYELRLWNAALVARLKKLSDQFKTRYNDEPYFEMVQFTESAVSPVKPGQVYTIDYPAPPGNYTTSYIQGLKTWVLYTNQVLTKTIVMQLCNYPRGEILTYIPALRDAGVGISCPNSMADEPGLWTANDPRGIWRWLTRTDAQTLQDVVPIGPSIQIPECYYSNMSFDDVGGLNGLGRKPGQGMVPEYGVSGAKEIIDLLKTAKSNYAFITRAPLSTGTGNAAINNPDGIIFSDWLDFFALPAQASTPHGGMNATKPSKLA